MSQSSWKSHFTQPISGYDPVQAQGLSELGYALQHQQISQDEYLQWARENFELASLDMKFFQTFPAPKALYEQYKDAYIWSPECLPVGEWDNHLLVACLEKPQDLPEAFKPLFFIAPVQGLLSFWSTYQEETPSEIPAEGEETETAGLPDGLSIYDSQANTGSQLTSLSFAGIQLASQDEHPPAPSAPETIKPVKPIAPPAQTFAQIPPIPNVKAGAVLSEETISVPLPPQKALEQTSPEIKAQPQILEPTPTTIGSSVTTTSASEISESQAKEVFDACKKHYEKLLYLEFNSTKQTTRVKYWPSEYVATESPAEHPLSQDSFLSIVYKTQKPYHGYVAQNSVAEGFFKEVNSGNIPENITLVPLVKGDAPIGAILGWGPKSTYTLTVLRDMEKAIQDFSTRMGWSSPEAA